MDENVTAIMFLYSSILFVATAEIFRYSTHNRILKKGGVMANGVAVPVWRVGAYVPSAPLRFVFWIALTMLACTMRGWWDWRTVNISEWPIIALYSILAFTVGYDVLCLRWNP